MEKSFAQLLLYTCYIACTQLKCKHACACKYVMGLVEDVYQKSGHYLSKITKHTCIKKHSEEDL